MTVSSQHRAFRKNKYFAKKVQLDGYTFDSKREAAVYAQLRLLEKAGKITCLTVHQRFQLNAHADFYGGPSPAKVGEYEADFVFHEGGKMKVVDVKGIDTPLSNWKRKHLKAQSGLEVEVWK